MFPELNIDWLRTFLAVADSRSFTKASQAVFRSQAAVSMQIKRLEESIEKPVFVRDTRNLELTRTGESLLPYARRLLNLHDETWSALVQPEVQGQVLLGAPDDYVSSLLPDVLRKFSSIYPRVTIELTCAPSTALAPMLTDNKIDMAILTRARGIKGKFIRYEPMCWATIADSDAWSKRPLPVALFEVGCACRIRAEQALKRGNLSYRIVCSSPSMTGLVTTVEAGLAVAGLARCSVPKNLKVIGRKEGLPDLERLEILIGRSTRGKTKPCEVMEELIEETLTQPD